MDRFKFRIWNKNNKQYSTIGLGTALTVNNISEDFIIQQCLGVKDKNNRLIYEGDIVLWKISDDQFCIGEIIWGDYSVAFIVKLLESNHLYFYDYCYGEREFSWNKLEVIGSIADKYIIDLRGNIVKELEEVNEQSEYKCKLLELLK